MRYLPDTNVFIALAAGRETILNRLRYISPQEIVLSAIVHYELFYGAVNSARREENIRNIGRLQFEFLCFDHQDAFRAAEIRASLRARGTPIGPYDILLAGQALARDLTLVTRNTREFARIEGLRVENWEV